MHNRKWQMTRRTRPAPWQTRSVPGQVQDNLPLSRAGWAETSHPGGHSHGPQPSSTMQEIFSESFTNDQC